MTLKEAKKVIRHMLASTDLSNRANMNEDMVKACNIACDLLDTAINGTYKDGYIDGVSDLACGLIRKGIIDKEIEELAKELTKTDLPPVLHGE